MRSHKFFSFEVIEDIKKLPNGSNAKWDYVKRGKVVVVLPLVSSDKILVIKQYRPIIEKWLYELPAGRVEKGETPFKAANRELEEETGFKAANLKFLFKSYSSPGLATELIYFYLATQLIKSKQHLDTDEIINTKTIGSNELFSMVKKGKITNGPTMQVLMYYNLFEKGRK